MSEKKVCFDVCTPVNFLVRSVGVYGDKDAVVYSDRRFNYNKFYERVNRLARALLKIGGGKRGQGSLYLSQHLSLLEPILPYP